MPALEYVRWILEEDFLVFHTFSNSFTTLAKEDMLDVFGDIGRKYHLAKILLK